MPRCGVHPQLLTAETRSARLMLVGFGTAHHQPAAQEFLVVQFLDGALRFLDGLHLHKAKPFERWLCR